MLQYNFPADIFSLGSIYSAFGFSHCEIVSNRIRYNQIEVPVDLKPFGIVKQLRRIETHSKGQYFSMKKHAKNNKNNVKGVLVVDPSANTAQSQVTCDNFN